MFPVQPYPLIVDDEQKGSDMVLSLPSLGGPSVVLGQFVFALSYPQGFNVS